MSLLSRRRILGVATALPFFAVGARAEALAPKDLILTHADGRQTRYIVRLPASGSAGVVLFSHGAGSTGPRYDRLFDVWSRAGLMVIAPDHLSGQTPAESWAMRLADMNLPWSAKAEITEMAQSHGVVLDWSAVAIAGHSYGALTALALAGAVMEAGFVPSHRPLQVAALLALSPPGPLPGMIGPEAWESVAVPSLLQLGDADIVPGLVPDARHRRIGYRGKSDQERWLLLSPGADHVFGGLYCDAAPGPLADSQAEAFTEMAETSAAFLRAATLGDPAARQGLTRAAEASPQGRLSLLGEGEAGPSLPALRVETLPEAGGLRIWAAEAPWAVLGCIPGAGCKAERYDWLGLLALDGVSVVVFEPEAGPPIGQFEIFLNRLKRENLPVLMVGHSAGAAVVLDALASAESRNPRLVYPDGFAPPQDLAGVAILGCSLQPEMLDFVLPHRQSEGRLTRPAGLPLLFVSGDRDRIATPQAVERTRQRYEAPAEHQVLAGGTHYGFATGRYPSDNPQADAVNGSSSAEQRAQTLVLIKNWASTLTL